MKILLLTSGGDAPGMNCVLHYLTKKLKLSGHGVFASRYGFQGLLDDNIIELDTKLTAVHKFKAGSFIKSSRCLEFKQEKGQKRGLKTLKKHDIDVTVIIGGDGSYKGAISLAKYGEKVIFLPATIDRDLHYETYSMGFFTAVKACCDYINNVKLTMDAFDRTCIYEIMGRDNSSLTDRVAQVVKADLVITKQNKNKLNLSEFAKKHRQNPCLTVLLQENLMPISHVESLLASETGGGVRSCVIGYVQRGTDPTKEEVKMAKRFAKYTVKQVKNKNFGIAIAIDEESEKNLKLIY